MPRRHPYSRDQGPLHLQPPNAKVQRSLTVPANALPCVKVLIAAMKEAGRSYDSVAEASGVLRCTMKSWRHRSSPSFATIEACFNAIGWGLIPAPKIEVLPDDIAADFARLAAKMKTGLPEVWSALADLAADQAFLRERAEERIEAREAEREALRVKRTRSRRKPKTPANDNIKQTVNAA